MNIENNERKVPYYALHENGLIAGFFGSFSFLSNFYILKNGVCFEEIFFPSVEHAYQAAKWPIELRVQFVDVTAGKAKQLGGMAPKFDARKWNKKKYSIMEALVNQKFINNLELQSLLLMLDGYHLEERNSWNDKFWGTDINGHGENKLGIILMTIRDIMIGNRDKSIF